MERLAFVIFFLSIVLYCVVRTQNAAEQRAGTFRHEGPRYPIWLRFLLAAVIGCFSAYPMIDDPNPAMPFYGGALMGICGQWLACFCHAWLTHGWRVARHINWTD